MFADNVFSVGAGCTGTLVEGRSMVNIMVPRMQGPRRTDEVQAPLRHTDMMMVPHDRVPMMVP